MDLLMYCNVLFFTCQVEVKLHENQVGRPHLAMAGRQASQGKGRQLSSVGRAPLAEGGRGGGKTVSSFSAPFFPLFLDDTQVTLPPYRADKRFSNSSVYEKVVISVVPIRPSVIEP